MYTAILKRTGGKSIISTFNQPFHCTCSEQLIAVTLLILCPLIQLILILPPLIHYLVLELLDGLRPSSPKPGHIERVAPEQSSTKEEDTVITQRFLKINVRHITDGQGVVGGVLLVTPNAVMFDPNVSDPLVIDRGPENYGVIAPMELVVNAAIFHDIAHMRVGNEQSNEKPDVYYPKPTTPPPHVRFDGSHSPGNDSLLVKDETFPELGASSVDCGDDQESICSSHDREGAAFPKAFDRDLVTPTTMNRDADTKDNNGEFARL